MQTVDNKELFLILKSCDQLQEVVLCPDMYGY